MSDFQLVRSAGEVVFRFSATTWPAVEIEGDRYRAAVLASQKDQPFATVCRHIAEGDAVKAGPLLRDLRGHFAMVLWSDAATTIVTDCAGSIDLYFGTSPDGTLAVSTNVSAAAKSLRAGRDDVSVRDFIYNQMICHPFTWYAGIFAADPATITTLAPGRTEPERHPYWTPDENYLGTTEAVALVKSSFGRSVETAVGDSPRVSLLYSGGDDSRAVASHVPPGVHRQGYIFLEAKNRELALAKASAGLLGFKVRWLRQSAHHYLDEMPEKLNRLGAGCPLDHAHVYGHHKEIAQGPVIGGWGADTFMKLHYVAAGRRKRQRMTDAGFAGSFGDAIRDRYNARRAALSADLPKTAPEWQWFWPASQHEHYATFASARRLLPMHEPFISNEMVQVWARISPEDKASNAVYRRAIARRMGWAKFLPRSGGTIVGLPKSLQRAARPLVKLLFWLSDTYLYSAEHHGPWKGSRYTSRDKRIATAERQALGIVGDVPKSRLMQSSAQRSLDERCR